jgi:hypothetical protein
MTSPIEIAAVPLVNRVGELLLQLRDGHGPLRLEVWGVPGGHEVDIDLWKEGRRWAAVVG